MKSFTKLPSASHGPMVLKNLLEAETIELTQRQRKALDELLDLSGVGYVAVCCYETNPEFFRQYLPISLVAQIEEFRKGHG